MIYAFKLKPSKDITGLLPAFFCLIISGLTAAVFGPYEAFRIMAIIILIYSIFTFIAVFRTKSPGYVSSAFYMLFFSLYLFSVDIVEGSRKILYQTYSSKIFLVLCIISLIVVIYMLITKQVKWRGREILELSALNVDENSDTYTDRPRPVGMIDLKKDDLLNFAAFLSRHLIVMPYYEQERILFVPVKMGDEYRHLFGINVNYWDKTWVAFDFDGNISSHISKKDYLDFKSNLEFDNLCESLGKLFIEFFNYFQSGEETRIVDKLNEVKVGYFV